MAALLAACGGGGGGAAAPTTAPSTTGAPQGTTSAPSTTSTTSAPQGTTCSAGRAGPVSPQPALPPAVSAVRTSIVDAARRCDYGALARLALQGERAFTYSFGQQGRPAAFWEAEESAGRPVMRSLIEVLDAPFATRTVEGTTQYLWPSAYGYERWDDVPAGDREALRPLYGDEDFGRFERFGSYAGHRVGITDDGDWVFFVAGD